MKNILLISVIALFCSSQLFAMDNDYVPFVREGVKWICYYHNTHEYPYSDRYFSDGKNYFTLEIKGDTIIEGKTYKAIHKYCGESINTQNDTILLYVREEDKTVYGIAPEGHHYTGFIIGYGEDYCGLKPSIFSLAREGSEFVLYDFDDPENYYLNIMWLRLDSFKYMCCETIALGDNQTKQHVFYLMYYRVCIIEGVGFDGQVATGYPLGYLFAGLMPGPGYYLSHVIENGKIIYKGFHYDPDEWGYDGIDEVATDVPRGELDGNYYNLMGQPVGKEVPTTPGIYIHQGKKIIVR